MLSPLALGTSILSDTGVAPGLLRRRLLVLERPPLVGLGAEQGGLSGAERMCLREG